MCLEFWRCRGKVVLLHRKSNAIVAQLVEHWLPKPRVAGSSPVYRSERMRQAETIVSPAAFTVPCPCDHCRWMASPVFRAVSGLQTATLTRLSAQPYCRLGQSLRLTKYFASLPYYIYNILPFLRLYALRNPIIRCF